MKDCEISDKEILKIYKIIGENVKNARKDKGVTQLNLSLAIGHKSVGTISVGELGINNKHFNIEHLVKIADVLDVDINDFFKNLNI